MSLSTAQLVDYTGHIDKILAGADLSTVSVKKVRNQLDLTGLDIDSDTKKALNTLIEQRFDVAIAAQDPVKEEDESEDGDEQPKKKRAKREKEEDDHDAKLAAMLQAEENRSSRSTRATRGSAKGTAKPVKKAEKKTRKKKVVELEYDSEGNEIVKKKSGAFNKEWALSEPLSILVGGATQMSRPQTVKKIWEHIKAHDLQVPTDKRQINCDDKMRAVFKCDQVHMFTMNKLLGKHFYPINGDDAGLVSTKEEVKKEQKVRSDGKKSAVRVKDESEEEAEADEVAEEAMHTPKSTQESYKEESKESSEEPSTKDVSEAPETREGTPSSEED